MKFQNRFIQFTGALLMAGAALAACSKEVDELKPQDVEKSEAAATYILRVSTAATKALADNNDGRLESTWEVGDSIQVINKMIPNSPKHWLYATEAGSNTTFEGTVTGYFNQGDTLLMQFKDTLTTNGHIKIQDGTLEGVADKLDYAYAEVLVKEIELSDSVNVVYTDPAVFEKKNAVVKFKFTDRKTEASPVKMTSLNVSIDSVEVVNVIPVAAIDSMYVAVPVFADTLTLKATDEDGYNYLLTVPNASFDAGKFYERTLQMKRTTSVKAPVAKAGLAYTGDPQELVDSAHVVNNVGAIVDHEKDSQNDTCVIYYFVKKEVTEDTIPEAPEAEEDGWSSAIPAQTHAGKYYVWTKMKSNNDYTDVDVCDSPVAAVIAKAGTVVVSSIVAVPDSLTYSGDTLILAITDTLKLSLGTKVITDSTDANNVKCAVKYAVTTANAAPAEGWGSAYKAVNAGTYYLWAKVMGNADIKECSAVLMGTKVIGRATGAITSNISDMNFAATDTVNTVKTIPVSRLGDGQISAQSSKETVATVRMSGDTLIIKRVSAYTDTTVITVHVAQGTNHTAVDTTFKVSLVKNPTEITLWEGTAKYGPSLQTVSGVLENVSSAVDWNEVDGSKFVLRFYYKDVEVAAQMQLWGRPNDQITGETQIVTVGPLLSTSKYVDILLNADGMMYCLAHDPTIQGQNFTLTKVTLKELDSPLH